MSRSGARSGGKIPSPAMLPGLGAPRRTASFADLLPRVQPTLNAALAKCQAASVNSTCTVS
jgi:hypothetical protein